MSKDSTVRVSVRKPFGFGSHGIAVAGVVVPVYPEYVDVAQDVLQQIKAAAGASLIVWGETDNGTEPNR